MTNSGVNRLATQLAIWFGCGRFPYGPGTAGALGGLLFAYLVPLSPWLLTALFLAPGVWAADVHARLTNRKDPQDVVIDEVLGQWITLAAAVHTHSWQAWLWAFVLFRFFDIVKPWPIRRLEKLPGGYGIIADDLLAGLFGAVVMQVAGWNNLY
jgi:phosphatidylglycerophosphatase A